MNTVIQESSKWNPVPSYSETSPRFQKLTSARFSEDAAQVFRSLSLENSPPLISVIKIQPSYPAPSPHSTNMEGSSDKSKGKNLTKYKNVTFQNEGRMLFPGEKRRKSTASILMDLKALRKTNKTPTDEPEELQIPRKVSQVELEEIVARLGQPTASSFNKTRSAPARRVSFQTPVKKQVTSINYFTFDSGRFKGLRKVSLDEMKNISIRLSSCEKERVPEAKRLLPKHLKETLGLMNSYIWKGIKHG